MKINEVEKITGLTQKAIRLYESKGLIRVSRDDNGYRNYSNDNIETLNIIKLLRSAGITVTDIKLYIFGVMSLDELLDKRKNEILTESGMNSSQYSLCEKISKNITDDDLKKQNVFTEGEEIFSYNHGSISVGIDIGTTTISAVVLDIDKNIQLEAFTLPHYSYIPSEHLYSEQSVTVIMEKSEKLLNHILTCYDGIVSIGISGQMHGIVYVNAKGNHVSPLINWQDKRAEQPLNEGKSACELIELITGNHIATGYGIATHYYNMRNNSVPHEAVSFCSIMDLFAMNICRLKKPIIHTSVAASFGLFDVKECRFMTDKLELLGIDEAFLPKVTAKNTVIGKYNGIPVSVALGDNQASFLGAVCENNSSLLVNIGTGSQLSAVSDNFEISNKLEIRPFIDGKYLICGSALCGGFAYSMLEAFFRNYVSSASGQNMPQYNIMNELASNAYNNGELGLKVDVSFCGKRWNPELRGSITMIDRENFTPSALIIGVLKGMCDELYELYSEFPEKKSHVVASGGAVRKNPVLRALLSDRFGMPISVNTVDEEAAIGAALFSAFTIGYINYSDGFSKYIKYE